MRSKSLAGLIAVFALTLVCLGVQASGTRIPAPSFSCSMPSFCLPNNTCRCANQTCSLPLGICR